MKKIICFLVILTTLLYVREISFAAEHPGTTHMHEHPGESAEHPGEKSLLSAKQIIEGIKDHISKVTAENGGYYPLRDEKEGKDLRLKLVKVHEDRVSYIKKQDAYFACTDFAAEDGKTAYDVDFWMRKNVEGELEVYKTKIHKKDGSPRFTYKDDEIVEVK